MNIENRNEFSGGIVILNKLKQAGYQAYFVGGCVRDYVLKKPIKDIDITTNATPTEVQAIFDKVIPVGIAHGTVIVRKQNKSYEVTTFRNKSQANEDTFIFGKKLADDLLYRDFTMNALAMDKNGHIIDLCDGQADLQAQQIKAVENPYKRFKEDPLRMVRACRFVSQLGFSIETETMQAIKHLKSDINRVAIERLKNEMDALINGDYFPEALQYLIESELIYQFPIFKDDQRFTELLQKENSQFSSFSHMIVFLYHLHSQPSITKWVKSWNGSNNEKLLAQLLNNAVIHYKQNGITLWLVYQLHESLHKPFIQIIDTIYNESITEKQLREIKNELPIQSRKELLVNGHLLMEWFPSRRQGKWIQQMLETIEYAVVMKKINNDEQTIKEWILCHPLAIN